LTGGLQQPITEAPLVILIYAVLVLMVASAVASVLLRNMVYAVGAFATTMLVVAILYLIIAPFLLFAVQLLIFTTVSAVLLIGLLRETSGLERPTVGPFSREWIIGGAAAAALLALVGVVAAATSWPIREGPQGIACCPSFLNTVTDGYRVALATVVILIGSAALGSGLLLASSRRAVTRPPGKRR
jgi:NADH:ubiquinone oxidoreductase subunit 6 (subunit J)